MTDFPTVRHVAATVTDLEISRSWYERLTGLKPVLVEHVPAVRDHHRGYTHVVFALSDGFLLALHAHGATDPNHSFDEFRPGLDHISFACADRDEVERWQERLEELGIKTEALPRTPTDSASLSAIPTELPSSSGRPHRNCPSQTIRGTGGDGPGR